ncbi:type IV secretion system protein VirB1 [Pectobacterium carotovorum]|nr:type IV secretion system protein VirB1 [Pectobacterium carotovorum]
MTILTASAFLALAAQCAPNVHPDTSLDVVKTESGRNPYAIAEIIPKSERIPGGKEFITHLPSNKSEAMNIVRRIEGKKRRYSVGLMQITSSNFDKLGVTAEILFSPCENLAAFEKIIIDCWERGGTLIRALSCYYTGNFTAGLKSESALANTSYIQRIGYPPPNAKYIVPGTKDDQGKDNDQSNRIYERTPPRTYESWDVLREYPRESQVIPPSPNKHEAPKEALNEKSEPEKSIS